MSIRSGAGGIHEPASYERTAIGTPPDPDGSQADPRATRPTTMTPVEAPWRLAPGDRFRGLRVHALLGAGAMGDAYLASHLHLGTPVVIKLFRTTGRDPLAEAHLAARVRSPHIVYCLDAGVENGVPYVIQRYIDGVDLEELLAIHAAADRMIPVPVLVRLAVDMFLGLSACHVAGVVHRDVKPPNLFLDGGGDALVGDFGIAVDYDACRLGEVAGTPLFMAPELWEGEIATARSDIYSAAATLHLLWQRHAAFVADTPLELARMHREVPYQVPHCSDPVAAYFGTVLARLLSKSPADRPESALAVARALERVATPRPELRGHEGGMSRIGDVSVQLAHRDICTATTDVIVSAANEQLEMERGVARALRDAGGEDIAREAAAQGPITLGQVVWTRSGRLKCKEVAHAAAALEGAICIQRAVLRTLFEAERRGHRSITFPALGTGVGGVPHGLSARLVLESIRTFAGFAPRFCREIHIALATPEKLEQWAATVVAIDAAAAST